MENQAFSPFKKSIPTLLLFVVSVFTVNAYGAAPESFTASYDARYGNFRASAERSLNHLGDSQYSMRSFINMEILGKSISSIEEQSTFDWSEDAITPQQYSYTQKGLGRRSRSITFNHDNGLAIALINDRTTELNLDMPLLDDLSSYLEIKQQLQAGLELISFTVIDKNEIKDYEYRVTAREPLETALGTFDSVKLERTRDTNSDRRTEIWLAKNHGYILLKLYQTEDDKRDIRLDINEATLEGNVLVADYSE